MFKEESNKENLITYQGPLTVGLVSYFGNHLKSILKVDNAAAKRVFRVFIELTQNVSYYSAENIDLDAGVKSGIGWFTIKKFDKYFKITTGNLIVRSDGIKLKKNCDEINSLNDLQLRELKRKTRGQALIKDIGAHIGLIQTSITSKNKLEYKITDLDKQYSFFTISVNIDN